jgi:hypothetical protein
VIRKALEKTFPALPFIKVRHTSSEDYELENCAVVEFSSARDAWDMFEACKHGGSQPSFIRVVEDEREVPPPLPAGWTELKDHEGRKYFFCEAERATQWTNPALERDLVLELCGDEVWGRRRHGWR